MIKILYDVLKDKDTDSTYLERKDINCNLIYKKILEKYPHDISGISAIEIETLNRCNNDCSFCPVNRNVDTRELKRMDKELFEKIIEQLVEIKYSGEISIFSNNEPLLDKRIFDFIDYAKQKLPDAHHSLYTNGILLDELKFERLINSLDTLYIDNYDDSFTIRNNIQKIIEKYRNTNFKCDVVIFMRKKNQILDTRGGAAPNRKMEKKFSATCMLPFMQLIVRPDGKVSRCCQDALGKTTMGNLNDMTIAELWENEKYTLLRNDLQSGERGNIAQCQYCDTFGMIGYPDITWKSRMISVIIDIVIEKIKKENKKICIYGNKYKEIEIMKLFVQHGIPIERFIDKEYLHNGIPDNCFVIFSEILCEILDDIDPKMELCGEDYLICDELDCFGKKGNAIVEFNKKRYESIKNLSNVNKKNTYIWGTGSVADKVVKYITGDDFDGYIDNNLNKCGKLFKGKKVISPMEIKEKESVKDNCIIIASSYYSEIYNQIIQQKLCEKDSIINAYILLE